MTEQNSQQPELHSFPGERGMPSVNEHLQSTAQRGLIVMGLLLFTGLACALGYWKYQKKQAREAANIEQKKDLKPTNAVAPHTFAEKPPVPTDPVMLKAVKPVDPSAPAVPGNGAVTPDGKSIQPRELDKSESSLMVSSGGSNIKAAAEKDISPDMPQQAEKPTGMAALLTGTKTPQQGAGMLGNRNFILAKGSFIDCALQTRLDSTVPGMTSCVTTRHIYSDNGKVLLIDRGSTVTGEYQANLRQGMARIFVLWTRIKTPKGIVISLDSPGTDPLGGAGVPGYINFHFWQRFGGALMLSLVDDLARGLSTIGSSTNGGQQNLNFSGTADATQSMAAEAIKNTINIPPTLYKNQGEQVGIYVARDLNFSGVYDVTTE